MSPIHLAQAAAPGPGQNLFEIILSGGPVMIPLGLCSVLSLAYMTERSIRLRRGRLYGSKTTRAIVDAVKEGGPRRGIEVCDQLDLPLARVIRAGLLRHGAPVPEVEKAVEDAGYREVRSLSANLRPLVVIGVIAPLLGLLGTVWGMILAFATIATKDALGKPELLAGAISQALVTTAAGLIIAIPTQAVYFYFKARVDRFVRTAEDVYQQVAEALYGVPANGAGVNRIEPGPALAAGDGAAAEVAHAHP